LHVDENFASKIQSTVRVHSANTESNEETLSLEEKDDKEPSNTSSDNLLAPHPSFLTEKITELEGEIWHQFLASLKGYLHHLYDKKGFQDQLERDVKLWRDTFEADNAQYAVSRSDDAGSSFHRAKRGKTRSKERRPPSTSLTHRRLGILKRIFILMRYSEVLFRAEKSTEWCKWSEQNWPIAALLSHGGRVIIQLPPVASLQEQHEFWTWLMTGDEKGNLTECVSVRRTGQDAYEEGKVVFRRMGSTHSVASIRPSLVKRILTEMDDDESNLSTESKRTRTLEQATKITVREDTSITTTSTETSNPSHASASNNTWSWMKNWITTDESSHQSGNSSSSQEIVTEEVIKQSAEGYLLHVPGTSCRKLVRETKTWGFSMRDSKYFSFNEEYILQHHRHWGMNIALGGDGNMSLSRKLIKANGTHGHVYFYYQSPDVDRYGAVMIGVEGSEYGHYDVTGCYHGLSAKSAPFSPTFGYKWHAKHEPSLKKHKGPDKYNSMLIDLTSTGWKFLKDKIWREEIPGETCSVEE